MSTRLLICLTVTALIGCSSSGNDNSMIMEPVSFSGSAEEQARVCRTIALSAPASTRVQYVGNIWREEVDTDAAFPLLWNQLTPENAGKWGQVEATKDNMQWQRLDDASLYAANNDMPYKFHTLVWGGNQPDWIAALSPEQQRIEIEQWIDLVAERFPTTQQIDVVNEPLHSKPDYISGLELIGSNPVSPWSWVTNTFAKARRSFPNSELLLNDFNILRINENTDKYLEIISLLQADDLIDGIGVQAHFLEATSSETISNNVRKLGATGLPIYISEFDLDIEDDQQQLQRMQELFTLFYTSEYVQGITFWGYRENQIWQPHSHLIDENNVKRPALKWLECYLDL